MVRTYDPKQVAVLIDSKPIGGFADGTSIKVSRSNDMFSKSSGMDGVLSRVKSNDVSGEITLTLAQTSPSNDVLTDFANRSADNDVVPITITDLYGTSSYVSAFVWVKKHADVEFSKDISNREWTLEAADLDMFTGGTTIDDQ
jgi:hypothetical protein